VAAAPGALCLDLGFSKVVLEVDSAGAARHVDEGLECC
jgi:hypothetical protein